MINSNNSSTPSLTRNKLIFGTLFFAFLGFLDATYLAIEHFQQNIPPCSVARGCETVLTSQYATLAGIPIALFGVAFYLLLIMLAVVVLQNKKQQLLTLFLPLTILAVVTSALLFSLQAFVIHAFCQYCLTSEAINIILLVIGFLIYRAIKRQRMTA